LAFQNIDPIWFLQPLSFLALSVGTVLFWSLKRKRLPGVLLLYSLIAYAGAIAIKTVFQQVTYGLLIASPYGQNSYVLGLYFGLQTSILEVGGAYLVARFAVRRNKKLRMVDGEGYGISLAFWENGILLGALSLVSLVADYAILSIGSGSSMAQTVYSALIAKAPSYFESSSQVLPTIALSFLERVSSLFFHISWGYLCFLAAFLNNKRLFYIALPMGMVDFTVPFAGILGVPLFETTLFLLAVLTVFVAWAVTKNIRYQLNRDVNLQGTPGASGQVKQS
jgi:hypothetical protein